MSSGKPHYRATDKFRFVSQGVFFWYLLFSMDFKILFFLYCPPKPIGLNGLPNLLLLEEEDFERILVLMCFLSNNLA